MSKYNLGFRYVIQEIENENIGTIIESEDGNRYELKIAEKGQRKYSRKDGTKLRFMTYDNINKMFRVIEENKEIEKLDKCHFGHSHIISQQEEWIIEKINELVQAVNKLTKEREEQ